MRSPVEIAVAVPTYNREHYLREALDAILAQALAPKEIFVCDDGSTDGTEAVLRSYGGKIRWTAIKNSGPAMARKIAIESTTAPWVALCDSDDIWMPDHLERLAGALEIWPETDMVSSNFENFNDQGSFGGSIFQSAPIGWPEAFIEKTEGAYHSFGNNAYPALLEFPAVYPTSQMFRRSLYTQLGGIDKTMARQVSEDAHLTLRLAAHGITVIDRNITAKVRRHEGSFSAGFLRVAEGDMQVLLRLAEDKMIPDRFIELTMKDIARRKAVLFNHYFWARDFRKARSVVWNVPHHERDAMFYTRMILSFLALGIGK